MIEEEGRAPQPSPQERRFVPAALDRWDVVELRTYVAALREEIVRAEAAIAARESHRSAADALFRRP